MDNFETTVVHFRTALAGFHKGDVTAYISQAATANRDAINKLNEQILLLQDEVESLRERTADSDYIARLEAKAMEAEAKNAELEALLEENGLLKNRVRQLEFKLEAAEEDVAAAIALADSASAEPEAPEEDLQQMELEAYRRAESMERRVSQRTHVIKQQLGDVSEQAASQFRATIKSVRAILVDLENNMSTLQSSSEALEAAMTKGLDRINAMAEWMPEPEIDE